MNINSNRVAGKRVQGGGIAPLPFQKKSDWGGGRVEENAFFLKKKTPTCFFGLKNVFFCFLKKKQNFVHFKKTEKPHSELFLFHHAVSLFS